MHCAVDSEVGDIVVNPAVNKILLPNGLWRRPGNDALSGMPEGRTAVQNITLGVKSDHNGRRNAFFSIAQLGEWQWLEVSRPRGALASKIWTSRTSIPGLKNEEG